MAPSTTDTVEYAMDGRGGFVPADVESSYIAWRFERSLDQRRVAVLVAAAFWGSLVVLMAIAELGLAPIVLSTAVMAPVLLALGAAVRLRSPRGTRLMTTVSNAVSGLVGVVVGSIYLSPDLHAVVLAAIVIACFFQFGANAYQPGETALAIATYVVAQIVLTGAAFAGGSVGIVSAGFEAWVLTIAFAMALTMARVTEREHRRAYAQERIIDAPRETIARERARREGALERELSHQVAERSRELGALLAKIDVTLDVRALKPGERFAERYRIVSLLGAGGMGAVYEVERVTDGEKLALKVVVGEVSGASAARFAREAEIGARVSHQNIVSIVDVGVSSGVPFLAMELVQGGSLESWRSKFGDVEWALPILRQMAEGVSALHDAGVVHRDLKPANVLLTESGAKISDFGISRFGALDGSAVDASADTLGATPQRSPALTATGVLMGTPLYMAPEGARSARALDASADVFALAIIAYEMLTGRAPFRVPALMLAMADQEIPAPAAIEDARISEALRTVVFAALLADPAKRPRARALRDALLPADA